MEARLLKWKRRANHILGINNLKICGRYGNALNEDWTFEYNDTIDTWGTCNYNIQQIQMTTYAVEVLKNSMIEDIICHEVAHALLRPEPFTNILRNALGEIEDEHGKLFQETFKEVKVKAKL